MKRLVASFASLLVITAVVAAASPAAAQPGRSCFWPRSIRGFRSVDNQTVYLRVSRDKIYALEFFAPCLGVNWTQGVGLRSRTGGTICEGGGNAVEILTHGRAFGRQRCTVNNVRLLTPDEVGALPPGARP